MGKAPLPHNKRNCYPPYPDHYLITSIQIASRSREQKARSSKSRTHLSRMVTWARKSSEGRKTAKKQEAEGKLGRRRERRKGLHSLLNQTCSGNSRPFRPLQSCLLRLDWLKRDCSQSSTKYNRENSENYMQFLFYNAWSSMLSGYCKIL